MWMINFSTLLFFFFLSLSLSLIRAREARKVNDVENNGFHCVLFTFVAFPPSASTILIPIISICVCSLYAHGKSSMLEALFFSIDRSIDRGCQTIRHRLIETNGLMINRDKMTKRRKKKHRHKNGHFFIPT